METAIETKTEVSTHPADAAKVMYAKEEAIKVDEVKTEVVTETQDSKTAEVKESEAKVDAEKPKEEVKYDLKIPEGSTLTKEAVDEIASFAKEQGLSQEAAQKLVERQHSVVDQFKENQLQQFEQKREEWWKEIESDKELGGDNFKQTAEYSKRALDKFAPDTLKKFLAESPYGNHPDLVRLFANIGKAMDGDKLVVSGAQSSNTRSPIDVMYDNSENK